MEDQQIRILSDGRRLDIQLSEASGLTRSRTAGLMEAGFCLAGGQSCTKAGAKPAAGTPVTLTVPAPRPAAPQPENIPLEILYEDDDLAVVVKPRGMVVHPAAGHEDGTLVNALLGNLSELGGIGGELRPGIVHRLDKDTSGLMMVAKNDETQQWIRKAARRSLNTVSLRKGKTVPCWTSISSPDAPTRSGCICAAFTIPSAAIRSTDTRRASGFRA